MLCFAEGDDWRMRGYKNFEGTPHPGDLHHLVEIGYTENVINENGYPEPRDVVALPRMGRTPWTRATSTIVLPM